MCGRVRVQYGGRIARAIGGLSILAATTAGAQTTTEDLKRMSLGDLLKIDVTTVSRIPEPTTRVAAAVHVITHDDIRRSGALSIPEALRLAPGMQIARINAGTWAIGMRGFADRLARSMLVLIDGRAVYSPLFAGTYWETQDTLLEDVDRIEVIPGPGGTLWGANAVNGIINIITKSARDTTGVFASAGGGSNDRAFAEARYGAPAGNAWNYRVYARAFDRSPAFHLDGVNYDGLRMAQGGFRADWAPDASRGLTVQGDLYVGRLGTRPTVTTYTPPYAQVIVRDAPLAGGNVLTRWTGRFRDVSRFQVQAFYARTSRDERPVSEDRNTFDVDFQHMLPRWRRHHVAWGLGYRVTSDRIDAIAPTAFTPDRRTDALYSGFAQDDVGLVADRLRLTLGAKFEHNDYSGLEVQPSVRLLWDSNVVHTFWASVARAVRTPSRVETDYTTTSLLNPAIPYFVRLVPNPGFRAETLLAYEVGYRVQPMSRTFLSFAGFFNKLDDVLSTEIGIPFAEAVPTPAKLVVPVTFANGLRGDSYGSEVSLDVRPAAWWRWTANYSYVRIQLSRQPGSHDGSQERHNERASPRHQVQVQSSLDLPGRLSIDALARYVSDLRDGPVPSYATADLRVAWQLSPKVELAVVGQNLLQPKHVEWPTVGGNVALERGGYVRVTVRR